MAIQRRTRPTPSYQKLADDILRVSSGKGRGEGFGNLPSPDDIALLVDDLLAVIFPGWGRSGLAFGTPSTKLREHLASVLVSLEHRLEQLLFMGLKRRPTRGETEARCQKRAEHIASTFLKALPDIRALVVSDVEAHYRSDPAATGIDEIVSCYPGLYAIAVYRAAHRLVKAGVPIVPRMMTELAHGRTGIDIHPGASIGNSFFIDHGTGIVIGETTVIGKSVRIYQGVTLGALSIKRRDLEDGAPTGKRHPTIEDDVIIYANATILGGDTIIGRGAVIGGNAWITYSVPPGVRVGVG